MITDLYQYVEDLMVPIEGGAFMMGSRDDDENARSWEKPQHKVTLDSFSMAKYLVTQELYEMVTGKNPSYFKGANRPVDKVSWYDAVEFCNLLSEKLELDPFFNIKGEDVTMIKSSNGYRLPTEAEWEYAARGGKDWQDGFEYAGSNELDEVGWYYENSHEETKEVGLKAANQLGLFDMSGNVFEWCWEWYKRGYYNNSLEQNPIGPQKGSTRVVRSGSWSSDNIYTRLTYRYGNVPYVSVKTLGFRITRAYAL